MDITSETCTLLLDVIVLMICTPAVLITPFFRGQLTDVFAPSNLARKFAMQSDKIYSN